MIKGHAKIELTNVKTGEKQVVEDDNIVTNAIKHLLNKSICEPKLKTDRLNGELIDVLFGGILLFENSIEENVNNYLIPVENKMIGNAVVGYSSDGSVPEFGNTNGSETTISKNGRTIEKNFVYDFGTSVGNGTISSVCLTNVYAGYIGNGNSFDKKESKTANDINFSSVYISGISEKYEIPTSFVYYGDDKQTNGDGSIDKILLANYKENKLVLFTDYTFGSATSAISKDKIRLYEAVFPFTAVNPCTNLERSNIVNVVELSVPEEIKGLTLISISNDDDNAYLMYAKNDDKKIYVWKISVDLKNNELITVTNNTGDVKYKQGLSSMIVYKNYLLLGNTNGTFKINMNDGTHKKISDTVVTGFAPITNEKILCTTDTQIWEFNYTIDAKNDNLKKMNGVFRADSNLRTVNVLPVSGSDGKLFIVTCDVWRNFRSIYVHLYKNPFMLSTINNLPEPITKTEDMVMKITYTITSTIE